MVLYDNCVYQFFGTVINTVAVNVTAIFSNDNNPLVIDNNLGIPVSGSIAAGFVLGFTRRG